MQQDDKPDLLVGIDLGQTCTGVAYNNTTFGSDAIRWIQKWPGRSQANENKVPTMLLYQNAHEHERPMSWGFRAVTQLEQNPDLGVVREWFKTQLDPENLDQDNDRYLASRVAHEDVRQWFRDYLTLLYEHIRDRLRADLPNFQWDSAKIEFLFSVPTTWSPSTVDEFKGILNQAGFGGPANSQHSVTIGLTEPEAAAVFTSTAANGIFSEGDVIVVCDAGGGTTDLSALKVTETAVGALSLKQLRQLDVVTGANTGSAAIDFEFEMLARAQLKEANASAPLGIDVEDAAWEMAKGSNFQDIKCDLGAPDNTPTFTVAVKRLQSDYSSPNGDIADGQMRFRKEDLERLFDRQIKKIFNLIDNKLFNLNEILPNEVVSHLVLSGGLGQSPYVQEKLRERYGEGSYVYPNAQIMQVRIAPDPQLSVCKGLVADRLRKLKAGESVLGWRCSRASYGLICKELYDKNNVRHFYRKTEKDPRDGKQYVMDSVEWFIVKGSPVSIDQPKVHDFKRKIAPGDPRRAFPTKIVVSYNDADSLPNRLQPGVERLCDVCSDLSGLDEKRFKEKNKGFWRPGSSYYEVNYQVKVIIGAADLRFELWFDGQKISQDNSIKVEWAPSTATSTAALESPPPRLNEDEGVPRPKGPQKSRSRFMINP